MEKNIRFSNRKEMQIDCSCGVGSLSVDYWDDEGIVFLSYSIPNFYAMQRGTWYRIENALKIIWSIILGKEYCFYELAIEDKKTVKDFKEFVANIDEEKLAYDE